MWQVVFRSTEKVAFSSTSKAFAEEWLKENNHCPETGKCLHLFAIRKAKK